MSTPITLEGKRVLVTGGSSGIGRAIAVACARAGGEVAITYRENQLGAEQTLVDLRAASASNPVGAIVEARQVDIAREDEIVELSAWLRDRWGGIDVWINNAGADILTGPGEQLSRREKLDLVLDVDLRGTVLASWAAAELMRSTSVSGGTILNMAWDHVTFGMAGENPGIYAAAKGGVQSFSKSLARELAPDIRVNILAPGFIETAFGVEADADWRQHVESITPLGRWGTPEDVAGAAVFLASDAARFITGQVVAVNGGVVM